MMSFSAVSNAEIEFEPRMPSMDHGSSNNQNPVYENEGFYHGVVNFNMTGDWELRFDIRRDDTDLGLQVFEINF